MRADDVDWELFRVFSDLGPAEAMRSWLEFEKVPTMIEPQALESGVQRQYCVFVRKSLAHRARWIVAQLPPTDEELEFLATGRLPDPGEESR